MGKKLALKKKHQKWTPDHDWRVRNACYKLRLNGDHRLADKVGQMPLSVGGIVEKEPVQLCFPFVEPF